MALVRKLTSVVRDRHSVHDEVKCELSTFSGAGGRYLQLDTFGRKSRAIPDKISQSIQFDREGAGNLLRAIRSTFDLE